jgi:hypothetical protein
MVKKSARRTRRTHTPAFKARIALAALREDKTMPQLCQQFELHANQITDWKRRCPPAVCSAACLRPPSTQGGDGHTQCLGRFSYAYI